MLDSSTDRMAWTQTRDNGMGSGMLAFNDKCEKHENKRTHIIDYYKSQKYQDIIAVEEK